MHRCKWCRNQTKYQLCEDCEKKLVDTIEDYNYPYRLGDILYTTVCVDHKSKYEVREVVLNGYSSILLRDVKNILDTNKKNLSNKKYNFNVDDRYSWNWRYAYSLRADGNQIYRNPTEVYLTKEECLAANVDKFINLAKKRIADIIYDNLYDKINETVKSLKPEEIEPYIQTQIGSFDVKKELVRKINEDLVKDYEEQEHKRAEELDELGRADACLMGQQELITDTIRVFLHSEYARKFNITGLKVWIEDGYVNASWDFNERKIDDLKNEKWWR